MEASPTKNEGPDNWRDFITATPYAKKPAFNLYLNVVMYLSLILVDPSKIPQLPIHS